MKEYDWALNFMQTYQQYLEIEDRTLILNYNQTKWYYYQKEFESILPLLSVHKIPLAFEVPYRTLMIRAAFELFLKGHSYFDLLDNKILTFQNYLKGQQKFANQKIVFYQNQLKILKKLTRLLLTDRAKSDIRNWLLRELNKPRPLFGKKWLLEKADELVGM